MASPSSVKTDPPGARAARRRPAVVVGGLVAAVAVAVGLWLTQPWLLLVDAEVDEAFPVADAPADTSDGGTSDGDAEEATGGASTDDAAAADDPEDADDAASQTGDDADDADDVDDAGEGAGGGADEAAADEPVALLTGEFTSRDHVTSGTATVFQLPEGGLVLRFEDLAIDNGPDLFVYLDDDPGDAPPDAYDDGTNLGRLKGNIGNQNYDVPAGTDLDVLRTVVIWCDRFASPFGTVELSPVA